MILIFALGAALFALGQPIWGADLPPGDSAAYRSATLYIAPSSSKLAGGTAKLVVGSLSRSGLAFVGDYRIKVLPYFFKNESGRLFIEVPDAALRQMIGGAVTGFKGRATTNRSGLTRKITAKAKPSAKDRGALTFTVATVNGPLVFNTSYRIEKR
ncbi:MAG: hypothetical protein ABJB49_03755 [Nitrospirota bacterium]